MKGSYALNNYGELFKALVRVEQPLQIVEFGILEGYSTYWFLEGLKANGKGRLRCHDLFEEYPYKHSRYEEVCHRFQAELENDMLSVERGNYWEMAHCFEDSSIDLMHIDISNNGETFDFFFAHYYSKLVPGGIAILEGGGKDRDKVEWMIKYDRRPIRPVLDNLDSRIHVAVFEAYPSITIVTGWKQT